ncbi:alpha-hydroxy-acid oxidizing protein [Aquihabitans sp. G128]|nr:alpha-hydroxy-acid oxidizing protein [Aquihabitans sp. G128]
MPNYGDWQLSIYFNGLDGVRPELPMSFADLERRAEAEMTEQLWSYVAGGAGDERTQRANVAAFDRWGLVPRVLAGAAERDLHVDLFGTRLPTPLLLAPVGVIGIIDPDGHGDVLTARAAASSGVPMVASTLMEDPLEVVAAELGETPGWFQLYPPKDRELCESFVRRAEAAGYSAIVVTLDTLTLGWRPRDLTIASFPQLQGLCLANYFSDPVFRAQLAVPPEEDVSAATGLWAMSFGNPGLGWDDLGGCGPSPPCPCCSRACATPTTPGGPSTSASTASTAPPTAAGRPTAACRRSSASRASSTWPATRR